MSKSKFDNSLWSTSSAPDQNRFLTFYVPIFIFLFHVYSLLVIPSLRKSFKKFVTVYFYLAGGGVSPSQNLQPEGPGFFIRVYSLIRLAFTTASWASCTLGLILECPPGRVAPSSRVLPTLSDRTLWSGPSDPLALSARRLMLPKRLVTSTLAGVTHLNRIQC